VIPVRMGGLHCSNIAEKLQGNFEEVIPVRMGGLHCS